VAPAPPVGSWATLGDLHLTAGTKGLWVDVGDRYIGSNLYRAELDAARFVLQYPDVNVRDYKYVHTDAMGTPLRATDKSGVVIWQAIYDPYGAAVVNDDPEGDGVHQALNLRLPGQYYDAETSLHYNYFRDYDPEIGRYLQSDPIGLAAGVNTYAYVGGNPISLIDPLGLAWEFNQSTGQLSHNGIPIGSGYAGHGAGVNNPTMQGVGGVGPLPQGSYTIGPQQLNITNSGTRLPGSMRLTPVPGNQMFDRSGFLIHGDNSRHNQSASEGCIVANKYLRDQIGSSGDNILEVYVPQLMPVIIPFW
jgi:RHS repeat-associated protein